MAVSDLVSDWRSAWSDWTVAEAAGAPVPVRNGLMDRIWTLSREIASRGDLHSAVTALCGHQNDPDLRVRAALVREHWDVEGAADTHASVILDSVASASRPMTMKAALSVTSPTSAPNGCPVSAQHRRGPGKHRAGSVASYVRPSADPSAHRGRSGW